MVGEIVAVDAQVLERLKNGSFQGVVHSVFARVVNIASRNGTEEALYPLAHREGDGGPGCLIAAVEDFSLLPIGQGDAVRVMHACLLVGEAVFRFHHAVPRQAERLAYPADTACLRRNLRFLADLRLFPGAVGALGGEKAEQTPFARKVRRLLLERAYALAAALQDGNETEAAERAACLLGFGPGLTPSGDDILLGLSAALAVENAPGASLCHFRRAVTEQAARATNLISAAGIREAARGRMRASIAAFVRALLHEDCESARRRLQQVLEIGSSSGADIAWGIVLGMEVNLFLGCPMGAGHSMFCQPGAITTKKPFPLRAFPFSPAWLRPVPGHARQ